MLPSQSVNKLLPSLIDQKSVLKVASSLADTKKLAAIMLNHQKSIQDMMIIKDERTTTKMIIETSILSSIVKTGSVKAFKFIRSMVNDDDKFRENVLYQGHEYPSTATDSSNLSFTEKQNSKILPSPIEIALQYNQPLLLEKMLKIKGVKDKYGQDKELLYRAIENGLVFCGDENTVNLLLKELNISNEDLIAIIKSNSVGTENNLMAKIMQHKQMKMVKKIHSMMGDKEFIDMMISTKSYKANPMELMNNIESVKYFFTRLSALTFHQLNVNCSNSTTC